MSPFLISFTIKGLDKTSHKDLLFSQEYILKGVVNAALGQEIGSVSISVK